MANPNFRVFYKSTGEIQAHLTYAPSHGAVLGAVLSITIVDSAGTALSGSVWPEYFSEIGKGYYGYTIDPSLLDNDKLYTAQVTAVSGSAQHYSELTFKTIIDTD